MGGKGQPGCSQAVPSMDLWLCPASLDASEPPWQGGLTPAAQQSTRFVPMPLNPPLKLTALSESFPFIQQWTFVPAAPAPAAPGCAHASANTPELRRSFFWPYLLTKPTVFMEWGYVKEQRPFSLQQSCHSSSHGPGENLPALQSARQISHSPSAPAKAELKY